MNLISIEDFSRVELKIGKVTSAERIKKSNKLIKLQVDTGELRQLVAGIGNKYTPEELVGEKIVRGCSLQLMTAMELYQYSSLIRIYRPEQMSSEQRVQGVKPACRSTTHRAGRGLGFKCR
jgi:hypothetical protein